MAVRCADCTRRHLTGFHCNGNGDSNGNGNGNGNRNRNRNRNCRCAGNGNCTAIPRPLRPIKPPLTPPR